MLRLLPEEIRALQGHGGKPFTFVIGQLLLAHALRQGFTDADVDTTIRVNIPDGGVDTSFARQFRVTGQGGSISLLYGNTKLRKRKTSM